MDIHTTRLYSLLCELLMGLNLLKSNLLSMCYVLHMYLWHMLCDFDFPHAV